MTSTQELIRDPLSQASLAAMIKQVMTAWRLSLRSVHPSSLPALRILEARLPGLGVIADAAYGREAALHGYDFLGPEGVLCRPPEAPETSYALIGPFTPASPDGACAPVYHLMIAALDVRRSRLIPVAAAVVDARSGTRLTRIADRVGWTQPGHRSVQLRPLTPADHSLCPVGLVDPSLRGDPTVQRLIAPAHEGGFGAGPAVFPNRWQLIDALIAEQLCAAVLPAGRLPPWEYALLHALEPLGVAAYELGIGRNRRLTGPFPSQHCQRGPVVLTAHADRFRAWVAQS
jgi:hypothetical protein